MGKLHLLRESCDGKENEKGEQVTHEEIVAEIRVKKTHLSRRWDAILATNFTSRQSPRMTPSCQCRCATCTVRPHERMPLPEHPMAAPPDPSPSAREQYPASRHRPRRASRSY